MAVESKKYKILFVDDDSYVLSAAKRQLRQQYDVCTAKSSDEALKEVSAKGPFAIVISDLKMSGMSGNELLYKIKDVHPDTVCILLTGFADLDIAMDVVNNGRILKFLTKPCPVDVMRQTLEEAVEEYKNNLKVKSYTYTVKVKDGELLWSCRSAGCYAITGYSGQEFSSSENLWIDLVEPCSQDALRGFFDKIIAGEEAEPIEYRFLRPEGEFVWVRETVIPHKGTDGRVSHFEGLVEDINENKKISEKLRRSERRYERMTANIPGVVYQVKLDSEGNYEFIFIGEGIEELVGVCKDSRIDISSRILESLIDRRSVALLRKKFKISAKNVSALEWEGCFEFDGKRKWLQTNAKPDRTRDGGVIWDGIILDITDRKRREEDYQRLAKFVGENPNPVMRINYSGNIIYANKASDKVFKLWNEDGRARLPLELLAEVNKTVENGVDACVEMKFGECHYSIVMVPVLESSYVSIYVRDITGIKQAEIELRRANEVLVEHDKQKSEFVSTVTHELRTPLCIFKNIISNTLAGCNGKITDKLYEQLDIADGCIERLSRIISDFLDIAKIEAGSFKVELAPLNLSNLIQEMLRLMSPMAEQKGLSLCCYGLLDETVVLADHNAFIRILVNIVENALKFSENVGSRVQIYVTEHDSEVEIAISDDGLGIAAEDLDKIFDRFVQATILKGPGEHGTGLGLAICKELIDAQGGRIWVSSEYGKGSTFSFTLPRYIESLVESGASN